MTASPSFASAMMLNVAASGAGGLNVLIGATLAATLTNLLAALNASNDAQLVKMEYSVDATHLFINSIAGGVTGNAYTIAASGPSNGTSSGGMLAGGVLQPSGRPWKTIVNAPYAAPPRGWN